MYYIHFISLYNLHSEDILYILHKEICMYTSLQVTFSFIALLWQLAFCFCLVRFLLHTNTYLTSKHEHVILVYKASFLSVRVYHIYCYNQYYNIVLTVFILCMYVNNFVRMFVFCKCWTHYFPHYNTQVICMNSQMRPLLKKI